MVGLKPCRPLVGPFLRLVAQRKHTTARNVLPPVVQWVVSMGTGPGVLTEHLAYHIAVGTRPLIEEQTEKDSLNRARRGMATEPAN